tara:strand:- start:3547 stop:3918 length:372 start_codon:yes stop_codon:yes gene_type:complete
MIPYAFTGLASPAIKAIMSNNTIEEEWGEPQGLITSIISVTEIIGPLMMMWLFAYTTIDITEGSKFYGSLFLYFMSYFVPVFLSLRDLSVIEINPPCHFDKFSELSKNKTTLSIGASKITWLV